MNELSFEEGLKKLEETAKILEDEELPLKEKIDQFEEGIKTAKTCQKHLDEAENKIQQVMEENGEITSKTFEE